MLIPYTSLALKIIFFYPKIWQIWYRTFIKSKICTNKNIIHEVIVRYNASLNLICTSWKKQLNLTKMQLLSLLIPISTQFIYCILDLAISTRDDWKIFKVYLKVWIFIFNKNKFTLCKFYMERKQCHPSFPKVGIMQANEIISLVHSNVFGALETNTHFGYKYFHFYWWLFYIYIYICLLD